MSAPRVRAVVIAGVVVAACGRAAPPPAAAGPDASCVVGTARHAGAPVTLGLVGSVDPAHAPTPVTDAERVLFRQLYEPMVWRDCAGRLHPALATSWESPDGGRRWSLTLRADARFWDGRPVHAEDVLAAWDRQGPPGVAVAAVDEATVEVSFAEPVVEPWPLADPAFSIARSAPDGGWPLGTTAPGRVRHLVADDARDLLDGGADIVMARVPAAAAYARGLGGYDEIPLPWDRVYVLVNGDALLARDDDLAAGFVAAVTAFAREPHGPFWWRALDGCGYLPPRPWPAPTMVGYVADDGVARDLAARVVAVSGRRGLRAAPAREGQGPGAVVRPVPRTPFRPCEVARDLGLTGAAPAVRALLETRAVLLMRRATLPGLAIEWDGMPHVMGTR